ncbi:hypothetical protein NST17_21085 [Caldifermentibacillus hisashii]|uniref:Uncharacterized protein n=1 Tax=Caldifermentibacillus hisashii TaxID=996558 RepID=A0ABU9K3C4_9BACI
MSKREIAPSTEFLIPLNAPMTTALPAIALSMEPMLIDAFLADLSIPCTLFVAFWKSLENWLAPDAFKTASTLYVSAITIYPLSLFTIAASFAILRW